MQNRIFLNLLHVKIELTKLIIIEMAKLEQMLDKILTKIHQNELREILKNQ